MLIIFFLNKKIKTIIQLKLSFDINEILYFEMLKPVVLLSSSLLFISI